MRIIISIIMFYLLCAFRLVDTEPPTKEINLVKEQLIGIWLDEAKGELITDIHYHKKAEEPQFRDATDIFHIYDMLELNEGGTYHAYHPAFKQHEKGNWTLLKKDLLQLEYKCKEGTYGNIFEIELTIEGKLDIYKGASYSYRLDPSGKKVFFDSCGNQLNDKKLAIYPYLD